MESPQSEMQKTKELLKEVEWETGKIIPVAYGPYRHRIVAHCAEEGRQKAVFADGKEHPYFAYVEFISGNGQWIRQGSAIVPVLPDGRLIMVIEQRPAQQARFDFQPIVEISGNKVDLRDFGPFSSLEFPGGAVDPGEGLKAGFVRELQEETGVETQRALFYERVPPFYSFGSDVSLAQFVGVAFLSGYSFKGYVKIDGGLKVVALSRNEVERNIWSGAITSAQAALSQWYFYLSRGRRSA